MTNLCLAFHGFLLHMIHRQVRVTQWIDGAASALCYSAILLSLPQATAFRYKPLNFSHKKRIKGKRKMRDIEDVGLTEEIKRYCGGGFVPVVLASPKNS